MNLPKTITSLGFMMLVTAGTMGCSYPLQTSTRYKAKLIESCGDRIPCTQAVNTHFDICFENSKPPQRFATFRVRSKTAKAKRRARRRLARARRRDRDKHKKGLIRCINDKGGQNFLNNYSL